MHTFAREFLPQRKLHSSQEPEVAMFRGLRVRLTLWYSSVLAVALVLFGVALYFGVQYLLFSPVEVDLATHAHSHMRQLWGDPYYACSSTTFVAEPSPPGQPGGDSGQSPMPE